MWPSNPTVFEWSAKSRGFAIWIPETHTIQYSGVRYSDGYLIGNIVNIIFNDVSKLTDKYSWHQILI